MSQVKRLAELYEELNKLAPDGYAVGLHIRFATPLVYHSRYPAKWVEYYNNNLILNSNSVIFIH